MQSSFDIAIVGSGFAGSLLAMILRRLGRSVVLLEQGRHPRFAIGESSTPLANLMLEELSNRYGLSRVRPLAKWGAWQSECPHIACGLKRGFTFYHHSVGEKWSNRPDRSNQLLVGASPNDRVADTHWYRADFDHFLAREAQAEGAEYIDETRLDSVEFNSDGATLRGFRHGQEVVVKAGFLVDATGPRGFLHRKLNLTEHPFENLPETVGLYTHFRGVPLWDSAHPNNAPYPVDDAAVHHVFEGGWVWVLRFNNGITSAGVAAKRGFGKALGLADGKPGWDRLLQYLPGLGEQFAGAEPVLPFVYVPQLSFRTARAAGPGWALLPSAAGFVDPLLSTGFPLTLAGIGRLASIIERSWGTDQFVSELQHYNLHTLAELETAEAMVAALYQHLDDFPMFVGLSLLYFTAASFSETVRRLGRGALAGDRFLDIPQFGPQARDLLKRALHARTPSEKRDLIHEVYELIEPFDLAGFSDRNRRNWFPADFADLVKSAPKISATPSEIHALAQRLGVPLSSAGP